MKSPKDMSSIELLEIYSHYTKLSFRKMEEQEYLALLRLEIIDRMESAEK